LEIAAFRTEDEMVGHLQEVRADVGESSGRIAVQNPANGCRHVQIDRVVYELVAKHDVVTALTEESSVERVGELGDNLGRRTTCDRGHVVNRDVVAEHSRDLQELERCLR
jgi:hypothetical protein